MAYEKYHKTSVDCKKIRPHVKELIDRCGDAKAAADYSLVAASTLLRIMNEVYCSVQQSTARKILIALEHRRKEDRANKKVHDRLLEARRMQARIESHQERLTGY